MGTHLLLWGWKVIRYNNGSSYAYSDIVNVGKQCKDY